MKRLVVSHGTIFSTALGEILALCNPIAKSYMLITGTVNTFNLRKSPYGCHTRDSCLGSMCRRENKEHFDSRFITNNM